MVAVGVSYPEKETKKTKIVVSTYKYLGFKPPVANPSPPAVVSGRGFPHPQMSSLHVLALLSALEAGQAEDARALHPKHVCSRIRV